MVLTWLQGREEGWGRGCEGVAGAEIGRVVGPLFSSLPPQVPSSSSATAVSAHSQ